LDNKKIALPETSDSALKTWYSRLK
jgi:hypothetical protein